MPDLEKVIKGLEACLAYINGIGDCSDEVCQYFQGDIVDCHGRLMRDAIELLKAQTPIEPVRDSWLNWHCGNCRREIDEYAGDVYCPGCGRKVKWDG